MAREYHASNAPDAAFIEYTFRLAPIGDTSLYGSTGLLIHPDGKRDRTLGCIGVQGYLEYEQVLRTLRNDHGLKFKINSTNKIMKTNVVRSLLMFYAIALWDVWTPSALAAEKDKPAGGPAGKSGAKALADSMGRPTYNRLQGQISTSPEDVAEINAALTAIANSVQPGDQGQSSPWFPKLQSIRTKLTQLVGSKLQTDLFSIVSDSAEFLGADTSAPDFVRKAAAILHALDKEIIYSVKNHIAEQNATVSTINLQVFTKVFSRSGFVNESDWEEHPIPVDAAGIVILNAEAVVAHLKTRPWQEAELFLSNATATDAFARYGASGDGIAILKTKYATNQSTITGKWNELAAWLATQRPQN